MLGFSENSSNFFRFQKKTMIFFIDGSKILLRFECAFLEYPEIELERGTRLDKSGTLYSIGFSFKKYTRLYFES